MMVRGPCADGAFVGDGTDLSRTVQSKSRPPRGGEAVCKMDLFRYEKNMFI